MPPRLLNAIGFVCGYIVSFNRIFTCARACFTFSNAKSQQQIAGVALCMHSMQKHTFKRRALDTIKQKAPTGGVLFYCAALNRGTRHRRHGQEASLVYTETDRLARGFLMMDVHSVFFLDRYCVHRV